MRRELLFAVSMTGGELLCDVGSCDPVAFCNHFSRPAHVSHLPISATLSVSLEYLSACVLFPSNRLESDSISVSTYLSSQALAAMALLENGVQPVDPNLISSIRASSRQLVREFGFMRSNLAGTNLSPSAVHALIEIGNYGASSAAELSAILNLEKSSVSRVLKKLSESSLIKETSSAKDGREKILSVTEKGQEMLKDINEYANRQVVEALKDFVNRDRQTILEGISLYADALRASRLGVGRSIEQKEINGSNNIRVEYGYRPGIVSRTVEMHITYYSRHHSFGRVFVTDLSVGLGELMRRIDDPGVGAWSAIDSSGRIVGAIFVNQLHETVKADGRHVRDGGEKTAHLRMFIVEEGLQGKGVGQRLLAEAVKFVDEVGYDETKLWTFRGLEPAKILYERFGFVMIEEKLENRWGEPVYVQLWVRRKAAGKQLG